MQDVNQALKLAYLRWAASEQTAAERALARNRAFAAGEHGVRLTDRQKEYLGDVGADAERQALCNICARAVQIPLERLELGDVAPDGDQTQFADAARSWLANAERANPMAGQPLTQYDLYEAALRDGVACMVIGWDGDRPTFTRNDLLDSAGAGNIRLHYDPDTGGLMFASKRWTVLDPVRPGASGVARQTLYFANRIERYVMDMRDPSGWRLLDPAEIGDPAILANPEPWLDVAGEPLGIPVIPFANPGGSELDDVLMPQKGLNKSLADLFTAADMQGFPMLVLKGYQARIGSDGKPEPLKIGPGQAITLSSDGSANRIEGADLAPLFTTGVLGMIQLAAIIKGWPVHLFMRGEPPSGEALRVMEASLVKQVQRKQQVFGAAWLAAFELGRKLHRRFTGEDLPGAITLSWRDPVSRDETAERKAQLEILLSEQALGVSKAQTLREYGYTDEDIARMQAEDQIQGGDAADKLLTAMERR